MSSAPLHGLGEKTKPSHETVDCGELIEVILPGYDYGDHESNEDPETRLLLSSLSRSIYGRIFHTSRSTGSARSTY